MEKKISWLSPVAPPENVIIDAAGNEVILTPEELAIVKAHEQSEEESLESLMAWGGFKTIEEAKVFLDAENAIDA